MDHSCSSIDVQEIKQRDIDIEAYLFDNEPTRAETSNKKSQFSPSQGPKKKRKVLLMKQASYGDLINSYYQTINPDRMQSPPPELFPLSPRKLLEASDKQLGHYFSDMNQFCQHNSVGNNIPIERKKSYETFNQKLEIDSSHVKPGDEKSIKRDLNGNIIKRGIIGSVDLMQQIIQSKQPKKLENQQTNTTNSKIRLSFNQQGTMQRRGTIRAMMPTSPQSNNNNSQNNHNNNDVVSDSGSTGSKLMGGAFKNTWNMSLQKKLLNSDFIKTNFTAAGDFMQNKHFMTIQNKIIESDMENQQKMNYLKSTMRNKETREERTIDGFNSIQCSWDNQEKLLNQATKRNIKSSSSLMRNQELFRGKQLFLDKVVNAKNILHGYSEHDWKGTLREDYQIIDLTMKGGQKQWKPIYLKEQLVPHQPNSNARNNTKNQPREIKTSNFTFMNRRTPMNSLMSTDPKPQWQVKLDVKCQQYKQLLKNNLKKSGQDNNKFKSLQFETMQETQKDPLQFSIKSSESVTFDSQPKTIQFLSTHIEEIQDALDLQQLDYKQFMKILKHHIDTNDKNMSIESMLGVGSVQGQSKFELEKNTNLGKYIKQNMKYFIETTLGPITGGKSDTQSQNQQPNHKPNTKSISTKYSSGSSPYKHSTTLSNDGDLKSEISQKKKMFKEIKEQMEVKGNDEEIIEINYDPKCFYL